MNDFVTWLDILFLIVLDAARNPPCTVAFRGPMCAIFRRLPDFFVFTFAFSPFFFRFAAAPGMGLPSSLCLALKMRLLYCFAPQVLVPFVPACHNRLALLLEPFSGVHLHQTYQLF